MDELASIFNNVARLVAIVGGGISTVALCYAGIMWMTASGDPQKMGQARMALMGAIGGLVIVGIAFIVPRIVSQAIIEPVGGVALGGEAGADCDQVLKNQLVFQRGASTADQHERRHRPAPGAAGRLHVGDLESGCQRQRVTDVAQPTGAAESCSQRLLPLRYCGRFQGDGFRDSGDWGYPGCPRSLHDQNDLGAGWSGATSGRDSNNNIIVYWGESIAKRPTDAASSAGST